jgi:DNA-binding NarL/FixJ family response regulator
MAMMTSPDPLRVLVVDDHDTFAELLVGALDREVDLVCVGHATSGGEGVAMVERLGPDVVLMDIQLPDIDGFGVAEVLTSNGSSPAIVLTSSRDASEFGALVERSGARGFIPKAELSGAALAALLA